MCVCVCVCVCVYVCVCVFMRVLVELRPCLVGCWYTFLSAERVATQIADGLEKGNWVGVCNAAHVAAASLSHIKPFVSVAEQLGR